MFYKDNNIRGSKCAKGKVMGYGYVVIRNKMTSTKWRHATPKLVGGESTALCSRCQIAVLQLDGYWTCFSLLSKNTSRDTWCLFVCNRGKTEVYFVYFKICAMFCTWTEQAWIKLVVGDRHRLERTCRLRRVTEQRAAEGARDLIHLFMMVY